MEQITPREENNTIWVEKEGILLKFFFMGRHLHWGYIQLWIDWQLWSQWCQLSIKLSKHKSLAPKPPWLCSSGQPGANHIKAFASPSLPEGHSSFAFQNPCEFPLHSKLHVPAAQCETIRNWLCVNQMMTAWPRACPVCYHSLVASPLPWESGNWFPGPLWECYSLHLARHGCTSVSEIRNFNECIHVVISPRTRSSLEQEMEGFHLLLHSESGLWEKHVIYIQMCACAAFRHIKW